MLKFKMMDDNKKIKELRKEKQIPQKNVATELGISQSAVSKIENGRTKLTEPKMKKFADCLGVTPEEIKEFSGKSVSISIEGDNSGSNIGIIINELKGTYEQIIQDKERIIELQANTIKDKERIIAFLEKEK